MFEGWHASLGAARVSRRFTMPLGVALALFAAGCGSVAVTVEQPVGARVELYRKAKWFGACGPDGTP